MSGVPLHSNGKAQLVQTAFAPRVHYAFLKVAALCSHPVAKSTIFVVIVGDPAMVVRSAELNKLLVHCVPFLFLSSCKALFLVLGVALKLKVDGQEHLRFHSKVVSSGGCFGDDSPCTFPRRFLCTRSVAATGDEMTSLESNKEPEF
jgi:hypothetical protein